MNNLHPLSANHGIYITPGFPILYIREIDTAVFADLHLGFEEALARGLDYSSSRASYVSGMFIPRIQLKKIKDTVSRFLEIIKPRKIIINGDLKHAFDRLLRQEKVEVKEFIDFLRDKGVEDIVFVRGNHDNYLPIVLKNYDLTLVKSYEVDLNGFKILFTHGHLDIDISRHDLIVIGHEHPSIRCFGSYRFPAFLNIPTVLGNRIIVLPAVGPYHPGTNISIDPNDYLSPLIKKYGLLSEGGLSFWIELGDYVGSGTEFMFHKDLSDMGVLGIDRYVVQGREVAVISFSKIDLARFICGSF